jgi:hypothetical protein
LVVDFVDVTGIPHILEHSVLCGSRKYPVKEPFVELLKVPSPVLLMRPELRGRACWQGV